MTGPTRLGGDDDDLERERVREFVEVGPPPRRWERTDATTDELRARGWSPDPAVHYGCGCSRGRLCDGHSTRRAVEHYNPELAPPVSKVGANVRLTRQHVESAPEAALDGPIEHVWRGWFRELRKTGHRPVGWPTLRRVWVAVPWVLDNDSSPLIVDEDDPNRAELRLIVEGPAVPIE